MTVRGSMQVHFANNDLRHTVSHTGHGTLDFGSNHSDATLYLHFDNPAQIDAVIVELRALRAEVIAYAARVVGELIGDDGAGWISGPCSSVSSSGADELGAVEMPVLEEPVSALQWVRSADGTQWTAFLKDGRLAIITRLADGDEDGNGASFLPSIHDYRYEPGRVEHNRTGPVCAGLLIAGQWVDKFTELHPDA